MGDTKWFFIIWSNYDGCYIERFTNQSQMEECYTELFNITENGTSIKAVICGTEIELTPKEFVTRFVVKE